MSKHKKEITVFVLVSLLGLMALVFPFAKEAQSEPGSEGHRKGESVTGLLGGGQMLRTVPYQPLYKEQTQQENEVVRTHNPCKAVQCSRPIADAHPILDDNENILTDDNGNVWCKCDGQAELYYRVSPSRKY